MSVFDNYQCEGQMSIFDLLSPDTWSGKTYQEPSVQIKEKTSDVSLKKQRKSSVKMPLFLDLRGGAGHQAAALWVMGGPLLGEYMTHSFGECPSEENVSLLSQILEETPLPKYCLSPKACQGILRRAEKRGKKLPELLEKTLIKQSAFKNEPESQGGGKGILIQHERTGALSTLNNQSVLSVDEKMGQTYIGDNVGNTLGARDYKQPQAVVYGTDLYNQTITGDTAVTLNATSCDSPSHSGPSVIQTYQQTTGALTPGAHPGSYNGQDAYNDMLVVGGGTEPITASKATFFLGAHSDGTAETLVATDYKDPQLVCYGLDRASFNQGQNAQYDFSVTEEPAQTLVSRGPGGGTSETVGALCARDYKGVGSQYVSEGKCIIQSLR